MMFLHYRGQQHNAFPLVSASVAAGWSSLVARRAHNPKVGGSNPSPATNTIQRRSQILWPPFFLFSLPLQASQPNCRQFAKYLKL